jgi:hypothetical protein
VTDTESGGATGRTSPASFAYGDQVEIVGWDAPDAPYWDGAALVLRQAHDGCVEVVPTGAQAAASACTCHGPCVGLFEPTYLRRL